MVPIHQAWCIQVDITNYCHLACLYCSRYVGHLRKDQRRHMTLEQFVQALDSLKHWPKLIGIIGGEPTLHPQFIEFCQEARKRFPKQQLGLWTAGPKQYHDLKKNGVIDETFGYLAYNEHNPEQELKCKHQPLTVAIKEAIPDKELRDTLIDDCWVQRTWCPTINHFGAYFCEVAAAQDVLLNEGKHAWPVTPGWWMRSPERFRDQVAASCDLCGMAIPMERELLKTEVEKFSPELLKLFRDRNLKRVDEAHVELFDKQISKEEVLVQIKKWAPGNYRSDLYSDENCPEGLGFTKTIK